MMRVSRRTLYVALVLLLTLWVAPKAIAQYSSPNYRVDETFFGTGGEVDAQSANFRANQSAGSLGVGTGSSTNYDFYAGFVTPSEPFLEMVVMDASVDFGTMDPNQYYYGAAQAGACNCSFYVRTYQSSSYTVVTVSQPPTSEDGETWNAKTTLGAPSTDPSVEEFGINLVDNATPDMGANAVNLADNSFADGQAAPGYDDPDDFKYNVGDTVARSQATAGNPAIGVTEYTISYIAKVNNLTPAGTYIMNHDLVVVPTY
jgi:hypothetical protein